MKQFSNSRNTVLPGFLENALSSFPGSFFSDLWSFPLWASLRCWSSSSNYSGHSTAPLCPGHSPLSAQLLFASKSPTPQNLPSSRIAQVATFFLNLSSWVTDKLLKWNVSNSTHWPCSLLWHARQVCCSFNAPPLRYWCLNLVAHSRNIRILVAYALSLHRKFFTSSWRIWAFEICCKLIFIPKPIILVQFCIWYLVLQQQSLVVTCYLPPVLPSPQFLLPSAMVTSLKCKTTHIIFSFFFFWWVCLKVYQFCLSFQRTSF